MKHMFQIAAAALALSVVAENASAQILSVSAGVHSSDEFRGKTRFKNQVMSMGSSVSWASGEMGAFTVGAGAVMNPARATKGNLGLNELGGSMGYSRLLGQANLGLGVQHIRTPDLAEGGTTELVGSIAARALFSPTLTVIGDVRGDRGQYAELSIGHAFEVAPLLNMAVALEVGGQNDNPMFAAERGITHAAAKASFGYAHRQFEMSPSIRITFPRDEAARAVGSTRDRARFEMGVALRRTMPVAF
jgi:hypothetical protein